MMTSFQAQLIWGPWKQGYLSVSSPRGLNEPPLIQFWDMDNNSLSVMERSNNVRGSGKALFQVRRVLGIPLELVRRPSLCYKYSVRMHGRLVTEATPQALMC